MPSASPESAVPTERLPKTLRSESFKNIAIAMSSVVAAICVPVIGYWVSSAVKERETQGKFVELAVAILREDPTQQTENLRTWATTVINNYSGTPLNAETIKDLIQNQPIPAAAGPVTRPREANILEFLKPEAAQLAVQLIQEAAKQELDVRLIAGYRSITEQEALYAQGRTKPGVKITVARRSIHNTGLAFDIAVFKDGHYVDEGPECAKVGAIGKSIGLVWGGDFKVIKDEPHFETKGAQEAFKKLRTEMSEESSNVQPTPTP
jgi:peptidoglycan LD-endopeptidase CwlK